MRKLSLLTYLLMSSLGSIFAFNIAPAALTYSVEANPFSTDFGNNFAYYHVNLDLGDLTRVAKNGNIKVAVDFQRGMEIKETRFEKKANGAIYYITDLSTPVYNATVTDLSGNILLQKTYGGFDKSIDYGKERSFSESDLAAKWLNEKDQYLQKIEYQNLDFSDLEVDLLDLLETTPVVVPVKKKVTPKAPEKVKLPAATNEEVETTTDIYEDIDKEATPVNVEAAAQEEEVMKDPFGELKEPLADEQLAEAGKSAPPAPVDYEESSKKERKKADKKAKKMEEDREESLTPVLSDRRNIVKLNLPNLTFGNLTLNYERLLSARNSVALNVGYIRPQKPTSLMDDAFDIDEGEAGEFSGITATAEYRIYGKKRGAGRGFYFGPYARYANHKLAFNTDIEGNFTNADTQLSAIGLGGQIGVQWLIKDRIAIDWGILGLAAQWYTFKSTFTAVDSDINFDEVRAELESDIEDSLLSNKLEFTSDENSLQAKMPFLFGGARTYLSVGYKF